MTEADDTADNPGTMGEGQPSRVAESETAAAVRLIRVGLDLSSAGYVIADADGSVVLWNRAFRELWGLEGVELPARWEALQALLLERADGDAQAAFARGAAAMAQQELRDERYVRLRSGRVVEVQSWPLPLFGDRVGRAWRFSDVTELAAARRALEEANRLLEGVIEGAPYGIVAVSIEGQLLWANGRFFAMTGLDEAWTKLPPPERAARLEALAKDPGQARAFNQRWRAEPGASYAELFERKDGAWLRVSTQPLRDRAGAVLGQVFFYEDMTAQVLAERAAAESEARLRAVIEHMETGVVVVNRQGAITGANPAAARLLGVPADQIAGRALDWSWGAVREDGSLFPPSEMPVHVAMTTGAAVRGVVMGLPLGSGRLRWLLVSAAVLRRGAAGEPQEVVATFTDYTEHREREGLLAKARFLESFAALSAGVAHRLNNDLTAMLGNAWLVRQGGPLTADQAEAVSAIEEAARDAAYLVADLRAAATGSDEPKGPVELDVCLGRALIQFPEADRRRAAVVLGSGMPCVPGRPRALEAAFQHVLANAFEATAGPVEVRVTRLRVRGDLSLGRPERWEPEPLPAGEYAAVFVEDAGEGIAEEHLGRIFEPFFTTRFAGRGLGLPATAGIVREHGGYIGVHSVAGRGTTVVLAFPVPQEASEEA
ncbi:PAS domain-containing sensor histidine kinase [Tepidiforma thermophila]|uniref:histidine kinase n=1 Tax=Tepidiforma thermophila (strain KCTC 52669 / CGMCC 1.13589 / G233) TaxID=2761530 RepID=A0A2A9HDI1_TEPT2|nr:PAS domain-containing sensor histidine kinase [Tepidiforma thermophila]PFG73056.1 PAS domain S-box-containing protein [Tepidiforma thermophila]